MASKRCVLCGASSPLIAAELSVCLACIRRQPQQALEIAAETHRRARTAFNLPASPPHVQGGSRCGLCARECIIGEGQRGYCGLRLARGGRIVHLAGSPSRGLLHWYRDPLPTNCVADWVCQGSKHVNRHNLAVFYASCTLDCLFCQNWHFRLADASREPQLNFQALSAADLAACANDRTYCVCFFGGDPASQMPHALATGKYLAQRGVSVCWETAGTMHPKLLRRAVELSLESGGCIKFDLKAYNPDLHQTLTGSSNSQTLENFAAAAWYFNQRLEPPLVVASTLLVPGYIDAQEVASIAHFIADLNPNIPYALLGFHPHFYMIDLPRTSSRHASEALEAARDAGLQNVRLGNVQLLSNAY
jgi:pyruvate formate lyase activating enzyme